MHYKMCDIGGEHDIHWRNCEHIIIYTNVYIFIDGLFVTLQCLTRGVSRCTRLFCHSLFSLSLFSADRPSSPAPYIYKRSRWVVIQKTVRTGRWHLGVENKSSSTRGSGLYRLPNVVVTTPRVPIPQNKSVYGWKRRARIVWKKIVVSRSMYVIIIIVCTENHNMSCSRCIYTHTYTDRSSKAIRALYIVFRIIVSIIIYVISLTVGNNIVFNFEKILTRSSFKNVRFNVEKKKIKK